MRFEGQLRWFEIKSVVSVEEKCVKHQEKQVTINSKKEQISVTANMNFEFNSNIKHLP